MRNRYADCWAIERGYKSMPSWQHMGYHSAIPWKTWSKTAPPMTVWASNAGCGRYVADQLPSLDPVDTLLPALYTRVVIPSAVWHELQDPDTPPAVRAWVAHPPAWFAVQPLQYELPVTEMPDLGDGEREAIVLAQELHADIVLIDEGDGRREAQRRALTMTGTLGVLERAAIRGLIDLPHALARLQTTTFRARPELFHDLLARDAARKRHR